MSASPPRTANHLSAPAFPRTRYQGSKRKLADGIINALAGLDYGNVLDAFSGTGCVAHAFKRAGKAVVCNDALAFNHQIGRALIENDSVRLDPRVADELGRPDANTSGHGFIARTFDGIYFTAEENAWLDAAVGNVRRMVNDHARAIAWFALFQAALAKRPYNLFHRKNLYMRLADVSRGFGNKASWDRPFTAHVQSFIAEANAAVFQGARRCRATRGDALAFSPEAFDLVYADPPYVHAAGRGVDYRAFYHFLEGLLHYDAWPAMIDKRYRHRPLVRRHDPWSDPATVTACFRRLIEHYRPCTMVISYRSDGIPSIEEIEGMLKRVKRFVRVVGDRAYQYALSTNRQSREVLLIGTDQARGLSH